MIRFLISAVIWFYTIRVVCYSVYTFKEKNIAGGISLIFFGLLTFSVSIMTLSDIFI